MTDQPTVRQRSSKITHREISAFLWSVRRISMPERRETQVLQKAAENMWCSGMRMTVLHWMPWKSFIQKQRQMKPICASAISANGMIRRIAMCCRPTICEKNLCRKKCRFQKKIFRSIFLILQRIFHGTKCTAVLWSQTTIWSSNTAREQTMSCLSCRHFIWQNVLPL